MKLAMSIELISKEIVKPTSPTPNSLKTLKLSFIDQFLAPSIYIPIILFYEADNGQFIDHHKISVSLKNSLSQTLTRFYPLAGKLIENSSINCSDEGVDFLHVQVPFKLSEVIKMPDINLQNQFLPFTSYGNPTEPGRNVLLAVQLNVFQCGGVAIGVCVSHKIADGTSAATFINSWAAITTGNEAVHPIFDAAQHFPPQDIPGSIQNYGVWKESIVTRRFVFENSNIVALRKEGYNNGKLPTRVEAVSAFIWRRFMAMIRAKEEHSKVCVAGHAVNIRERMVPPLPLQSFGNLWQVATAALEVEVEKDYNVIVSKLSGSIKQINSNYLENLQRNGNIEWIENAIKQRSKGEIEGLNFTSWCRFPFYDIDFGWGKPIWVCAPSLPYKNVVVLMSTKEGDGIEALVNMLEQDMDVFEHDAEFLRFVS